MTRHISEFWSYQHPLNVVPTQYSTHIQPINCMIWCCQSERINIVSTCIPLNIWPTSNPLITFRRDQIPLNIINIQLTFSSLITCLVQSTCSQHHPQIIAIPSPWAYLRYYEGLGYRWDRHWENMGNTLILSPYDPHMLSVLPLHNSTACRPYTTSCVPPHLCGWEYLRRWGLTTFDNYYCHAAAARRRMCSFVRPL